MSLFSLAVLFVITKLMGYRQVTQLNMYDYINGITIGSIASELVMAGVDNILQPLVAMIVYAIVIICLSKITEKSLKLRKIIDGYAVVLYENDQIYFNELKKAKVDLDEFLMQCRIAGYFNLNELQTVVLVSNGRFSFFPKERYRQIKKKKMQIKVNKVNLPTLLVKEGHIYFDNLKKINKDEKWLEKELKVRNIELLDIILMYQADNNSLIIYTLNEIERNFDT